jgi:hypothetical protein
MAVGQMGVEIIQPLPVEAEAQDITAVAEQV